MKNMCGVTKRLVVFGISVGAGISLLANCYDDVGGDGSFYNQNTSETVICNGQEGNCSVSYAACYQYQYNPIASGMICVGSPTYNGMTCHPHTDVTIRTGKRGSGQCIQSSGSGCSGQCVDWRDINSPENQTYNDSYTEEDPDCNPPPPPPPPPVG